MLIEDVDLGFENWILEDSGYWRRILTLEDIGHIGDEIVILSQHFELDIIAYSAHGMREIRETDILGFLSQPTVILEAEAGPRVDTSGTREAVVMKFSHVTRSLRFFFH